MIQAPPVYEGRVSPRWKRPPTQGTEPPQAMPPRVTRPPMADQRPGAMTNDRMGKPAPKPLPGPTGPPEPAPMLKRRYHSGVPEMGRTRRRGMPQSASGMTTDDAAMALTGRR